MPPPSSCSKGTVNLAGEESNWPGDHTETDLGDQVCADSPLEEDGFELAVPSQTERLREGTLGTMTIST
jgi:hypothetical protein